MSGSDSGAIRNQTRPIVATTAAGYTLINGTGTFLFFFTPNDGLSHVFYCGATKNVTVAETGGQISVFWTSQGHAFGITLFGGGAGVGNYQTSQTFVADPNTSVSVQQFSALTLGASNVTAGISGG